VRQTTSEQQENKKESSFADKENFKSTQTTATQKKKRKKNNKKSPYKRKGKKRKKKQRCITLRDMKKNALGRSISCGRNSRETTKLELRFNQQTNKQRFSFSFFISKTKQQVSRH
jgi:hypothetical protein